MFYFLFFGILFFLVCFLLTHPTKCHATNMEGCLKIFFWFNQIEKSVLGRVTVIFRLIFLVNKNNWTKKNRNNIVFLLF
jgi:hypothetical protein